MAEALKIRVGYLLPKLFAHTFVFGLFADAARTVAALRFQPFLDGSDNFLVGIEFYLHFVSPFNCLIIKIVKHDFAAFAGFVHVDDALILTSPEQKRQIAELFDISSVNENIGHGEQRVRFLVVLFP